MKFLKLASAVTAFALSTSANAVLVTENFTSTVLTGDFAGAEAVGSFTYDDSLLSGSGFESLDAFQGLKVEVTLFGQTFFESNDIDYSNGLPSLEFNNGSATLLDFVVSEQYEWADANGVGYWATDVTDITRLGVLNFGEFSLNAVAGGGYDGNFIVNAVPVPAAAWLFGSGIIALVGAGRRQHRNS